MTFMNKNAQQKISVKQLRKFVNLNPDARQYFYSKADERWLDWLWENGFLDVIKEKAEDPTRYGYRIAELNYLVRVAKKVPEKIVAIILAVPVSTETFNPEVVDRFLWICSTLPAGQLARVIQKISDEKWIPAMEAFNRWGFEYEKMLKTLVDAKDYRSILVLAEAILAVRAKEEIEKETNRITTDNPFYFDDLSYTKVFEHLANVNDDYAEQAFALATKVMAKVGLLGVKAESDAVFPIKETFPLLDVDFFTLESGESNHSSPRDDVRELAAVIKVLANRLIGEKCSETDTIRKLYKQYIGALPQSRAMWRLRLFVLSLCPEVFKAELKEVLSRLFEVEHYYEIISGAEYSKALGKGFSILSDSDKREYVRQVIEYFSKHTKDKEDQDRHAIMYGSRILSMITAQLTEEERQQIEKSGFKLNPRYEPEPSIGSMGGGFVQPRGPITQEEFNKLPITDIAHKLRNEWTPEKLSKQNTRDDFLHPLNAEGASALLQADILKRLQDYVNNAKLFFNRGVLDQHYTYAFLRGIQEVLRGHKTDTTGVNWDNLIALCSAIKESDEAEHLERGQRERDSFNAWLAGWDAVHSVMADVIHELLNEKEGSISLDFKKYRDQLFAIISYLFSYPDPTPEEEKIETAKSKTKSPSDSDYLVSDPFTMAINSVRGRAFEAFVLFVYQDGKKFAKDACSKITPDVRVLYEKVLQNENTRAIMFMFGHYLPSFYFRDKKWIISLLPQTFPADPEKKYLFTAVWEGYLSNNLYEEMFFNPDIQKLYERGLALTDADYPKQKHFGNPDENIAMHFALAFMYYKDFRFGHALFDAFWKKNNPKQHADFVRSLGQMFLSGTNENADKLFKKEPRSKQQLRDLWEWMLKNYENPRPFIEFGLWINLEKDIFDPTWLAEHVKKTLEKTRGIFDWHLGLNESIVQLAKDAPEDTLEIVRLYLLDGGIHGTNRLILLHIDDEWIEALKILYSNQTTKSGTDILINNLILDGGSAFWELKKILDDN